MKTIRFLFIGLIAVIFCSCGNKVTLTPLPTKITETKLVREFDVDNVAILNDIKIVDSLLILAYDRNDYIFHAYNIKTGELVSKFGAKGRQANEFLSSELVSDYKHSPNNLVVHDSQSNYLKKIQLADIIDNQNSQDKISNLVNINKKFHAYDISVSDDLKTMVGTSFSGINIDDDIEGRVIIYDKDSIKKIVSPFVKMFNYPNEDCYRMSESCAFTVDYDKKLIAASYSLYDAIQFYDFDGNVKKSVYLSEPKQVPFILDKYYDTPDDILMYFTKMTKSDDFIFASRFNLPLITIRNFFSPDETVNNENNEQLKTQILKINWNGEIEALYQFDTIIPLFCVDKAGKNIVFLTKHPTDSEKYKIQIYAI